MQYFLRKLNLIRTSGIVTLILSNIIMFFTLGFFCIKFLFSTYRCGKNTDADVVFCNDPNKTQGNTGLILGKQLQYGLPDQEYIQRLERGKKLFESGKVLRLVVLGGVTGNNKISEAQAGKQYLVKNGVPDESIIVEDKSRHTLENLQQARKMLSDFPDKMSASMFGHISEQKIILITSRYHLKRSGELARGLGLNYILCAAEKDWKIKFTTLWLLLIEAYYLHWYYVGKYWSRLINNKEWLQRIT